MLGVPYLNAAFHQCAIFHADALGDDISCERTFAADVQPVGTLDVPANLAHDHNFAGIDVGLDDAMAADGHPVFWNADRPFNAAVNIEGFRTCKFTFNHYRFANGSLLQWAIAHADGSIRNGPRGTLWLLAFRWLQHWFVAFRSAVDWRAQLVHGLLAIWLTDYGTRVVI